MKFSFILLFFFCFSFLSSFTQTGDTFISIFQNKSSIENAIVAVERISELYTAGDFKGLLEYSVQAINICEKSGYLDGIPQVLYYCGIVHRLKGNYVKALNNFFISLEHNEALGNHKGQAQVLNQIGSIYRLQGNYVGALEFFLRALSNYKSINDTSGTAVAFNNIGIVYFYRNDYDKALDFYNQSLELEVLMNDEYGISVSYINIGEVYQKQRNYSKALDYYLKALSLAKKHEDLDKDRDGIGVLYNVIGSIYMHLDNLPLAQSYLNQSYTIFNDLKNRQRIAECQLNMGELSLKKNNPREAIANFNSALEHSKAIGALELTSNANRLLSQIYDLLNDVPKAYYHFKNYVSLRDSLFNEDNTKRIVQTEMIYDFEKRMQEAKLEQAKKDAIANELVRRQKAINTYFTIILVLLLTVVVVFIIAYRTKQKANEMLSQQKDLIQEKNEELLQQQEEILAQRDEIETKNRILEETQCLIELKNERIISSIEYAQTIQEAILPDDEMLSNYFPMHFVLLMPKDIVSGDFYWFSPLGNKLFAAVVDCTGHGVPGAFMSLIGNTILNQIVNEWQTFDPAMILELMHINVRKVLKQQRITSKANVSMDICLVSIDMDSKKGVFAGASRPLYIIQDGNLEKIPGDPRTVGGFQGEKQRYFTNHYIDLTKPTSLYLLTDGYADQMDESRKKFGTKRLAHTLLKIHEELPNVQRSILLSTINKHMGEYDQIDDICIMGIRI